MFNPFKLSIKLKHYHIHGGNDTWIQKSDTIILTNKRVHKPLNDKVVKESEQLVEQRFTYRDVFRNYKLIDTDKNVIDVSKSILIYEVVDTEVNGKRETKTLPYHNQFIIKKSWWTEQRLKFMFGDHWLNDVKFYLPLLVSVAALIISIIALAKS